MNNTRQTELLLDKSDHYMSRVAAWAIITLIGLVAFIFILQDPAVRYMAAGGTLLMFSGGSFITLLYMMKYARVNGMMHDSSGPPAVRFEQEIEAPDVHVVSTRGNQMLLSRYKFSHRQWWKLIGALRNWGRVWSRDNSLHESGIFTAAETGLILNASGVYSDLTKDFARMKIIQKRGGSWYVTEMGWAELHKSAGSNGVIT